MLQLDVLSSLAISGAGALVGAGMLRPQLAHDGAGAEALRLCRCAFAVIGAGLVLPVVVEAPLPPWTQAAMGYGAVAGVTMIGWAMAAMAGEPRSRTALALTLAVALACVLAALPAGTWGLTVVCTLGLAAASGLAVWMGWRLIWRPHDIHERLIGATIVAMAVSSAVRASYLLTLGGLPPPHLIHVPSTMVTPFTLMYGVLPVVFAALLHNVINARLQSQLLQRAMTDPLTGALSRHALADGASDLIAGVRGGGGALAVIMVDLDHFKQINDLHGHAGGDAVLRHAARALQAQLRLQALLVRYGGEEFVALVPVSGLPLARRVAERMRVGLEQTPWPVVLPGLVTVTASLGVTLLGANESLEKALARADEALYRAKFGGRNQVQVGLAAA